MEALEAGVIVLTRDGRVRLMTARARRWLTEYFGLPSRSAGRLPESLRRWVRQEEALLAGKDDVPAPPSAAHHRPRGKAARGAAALRRGSGRSAHGGTADRPPHVRPSSRSGSAGGRPRYWPGWPRARPTPRSARSSAPAPGPWASTWSGSTRSWALRPGPPRPLEPSKRSAPLPAPPREGDIVCTRTRERGVRSSWGRGVRAP